MIHALKILRKDTKTGWVPWSRGYGRIVGSNSNTGYKMDIYSREFVVKIVLFVVKTAENKPKSGASFLTVISVAPFIELLKQKVTINQSVLYRKISVHPYFIAL